MPSIAQASNTDNGNPALIKWQGQEESKASRFLAKVDNTTDLATIQTSTNDNWQFYDNPQQKLILNMDLNKPATILSEKATATAILLHLNVSAV